MAFRSEGDAHAWRHRRGLEAGEVLSIAQCWELARAWYRDRASPDWRPRTPRQTEAVFAQVGLSGPFWELGQ